MTGTNHTEKCAAAENGTERDYFHMNSNFGGIPEVLVIDSLTFLCLLVVFFIIWRGGLKRLTGLFCSKLKDLDLEDERGRGTSKTSVLGKSKQFLGCLLFSEEKMLATAGFDAVQYLRFQIYLIGFLFMVCFLSIGVILPINLQGEKHRNASSPSAPYAQTVFDNLDSRYST